MYTSPPHTHNNNMVDVTGIDRQELLRALWENAEPAAFFQHIPIKPSFHLDEALAEVQRGSVATIQPPKSAYAQFVVFGQEFNNTQ